jgi:hypothetical protein
MPGPLQTGYKLNQPSIAPNVKMRRHSPFGNSPVIRVSTSVQRISKQALHTIAAKLVGGQTDIVDYKQIDIAVCTLIKIR